MKKEEAKKKIQSKKKAKEATKESNIKPKKKGRQTFDLMKVTDEDITPIKDLNTLKRDWVIKA